MPVPGEVVPPDADRPEFPVELVDSHLAAG